MFSKIYAFFCKIACEWWWPRWSNFKFRKSLRTNIEIQIDDRLGSLSDIRQEVKKLYSKFTWTKDGADQLWDAICPPPQNYQYYLDGELKDDCDGFHSLVYHVLFNNNIKCYLLAVCAPKSSHCVLIFQYNDLWYINDYSKIYGDFSTSAEAIQRYNETYAKRYNSKPVVYNCCESYNYDTGKFKSVKVSKIS